MSYDDVIREFYDECAQPEDVKNAWLDLAERTCEREDLMCFSEHFLYIARKGPDPANDYCGIL